MVGIPPNAADEVLRSSRTLIDEIKALLAKRAELHPPWSTTDRAGAESSEPTRYYISGPPDADAETSG
jgi:hypothetical protein